MDLTMTLAKVAGMKPRIDDILKSSTYDEHADLSGLHVDNKDRAGSALPDDRAVMCIPQPCTGKETEGIITFRNYPN